MLRSLVRFQLAPLTHLPGDVAQLVEHLLCTQGVRGSSPLISTRSKHDRMSLASDKDFVSDLSTGRIPSTIITPSPLGSEVEGPPRRIAIKDLWVSRKEGAVMRYCSSDGKSIRVGNGVCGLDMRCLKHPSLCR